MRKLCLLILILIAGSASAHGAANAKSLLEDFARAWRGAEEFKLTKPVTIGFWIKSEKVTEAYVITLTNQPRGSLEARDAKDEFTLGFETDLATLKEVHSGKLSALTAMVQARSSDPIPLVPKFPKGFAWNAETRGFYIPLMFHFWNREWPEVVPFGVKNARKVHGGLATVFFYDSGVRSSWYRVEPGMHINKKKEDQVNDFHSYFIVTKGPLIARIAGKRIVFQEGQSVFVPAGMPHEFWSEGKVGEFIILMFGKGA